MIRGKNNLAYINLGDFTDFQGIGHDPLYMRYQSVYNVIRQCVPSKYQDFLSEPEYKADSDEVSWWVKPWKEGSIPIRYTELTETEKAKYSTILANTIKAYEKAIKSLTGDRHKILEDATKFVDENYLYCYDDMVVLGVWGMRPDMVKNPNGVIAHEHPDIPKSYVVRFSPGEHGKFLPNADSEIRKRAGSSINELELPEIEPEEGYEFKGWDKDNDTKINGNTEFVAQYEEIKPETQPEPEPQVEVAPPPPPIIEEEEKENEPETIYEPEPEPEKPPQNTETSETQEKEKKPKGCLKWLIWLLLIILLLLLLGFLLRSCQGCNNSHHTENETGTTTNRGNPPHSDYIPSPIDTTYLGDDINHNDGGVSDYHSGIIPVSPELTPIPNPDFPDGPQILPNVTSLFFEDDDADLNSFAREFREIYPDKTKYQMEYDELVKRISIMMPEEERASLKQNITEILGGKYKFIVVDETVFDRFKGKFTANGASTGWHLDAVNAYKAWETTRGDSSVIIGIVDDGFETSHEMLRGRIVKPYNVFTQDTILTLGEGHGTHVAALAGGNTISDNISGLAPQCRIMPVQVFSDNSGHTFFTAIISGIAYAIHSGASVINISIGCNLDQLSALPESKQEEIAKKFGKNEQIIWNKIYSMARKKNVVLVFAAGNSNVVSYLDPQNRPDSVISVTAVDNKMNGAKFTNYGLGSTISAPGVDIVSAIPGNRTTAMSGTSMAAPIVTGVVALMKSQDPSISASKVIEIIIETGKPLKNSKIGPLIQADMALGALAGNQTHSSGKTESNADYSDILKQIQRHRDSIAELSKLLPDSLKNKIKNE